MLQGFGQKQKVGLLIRQSEVKVARSARPTPLFSLTLSFHSPAPVGAGSCWRMVVAKLGLMHMQTRIGATQSRVNTTKVLDLRR